MSIRTILTAALVVGSIASPAFAANNSPTETSPSKAIEFFTTGQSQRLVEGRNSDRTVVVTNKAQAATSQGFAPVNTDIVARGSNN
jgi:hypothetical protein